MYRVATPLSRGCHNSAGSMSAPAIASYDARGVECDSNMAALLGSSVRRARQVVTRRPLEDPLRTANRACRAALRSLE
jgi:hypothetical protein